MTISCAPPQSYYHYYSHVTNYFFSQTKKLEIPMELPREQIQAISKCVSSIEERFRGLGSGDKKETEKAAAAVPVG